MKINHLITEKLHSLFTTYGLKLTEQLSSNIKYESDDLIVGLTYNSRESSNTLWVRRRQSQEVEIDNQVLLEHFNSDLKLSNLPKTTFLNNVFLFFMSDGEKLLKESEAAMISLEKFNEQRSTEYTLNLIERQYLEAAKTAWDDGNYSDFLKYSNKLDKDNLPPSFRKKYKISKQRIKDGGSGPK